MSAALPHPLLSDTALVFGRYARQTLRSRFQMLFGVLMPLLYLLFFGPLLTGLPLGPPAAPGRSWYPDCCSNSACSAPRSPASRSSSRSNTGSWSGCA